MNTLKRAYNVFKKKNYCKDFGWFLIAAVIFLEVFLFAKRIIFPDHAFDTINYHFFLGKNGFENFPLPFKTSEFYPVGMHSFNPIVDMIGYSGYLVLGYRLGTIFSLISLVVVAVLGYLLLKKAVGEKIAIIGLAIVPPVFIINEGLFQLGTYFTDNFYSLILVLYVFVLFKFISAQAEKTKTILLLILGLVAGLIATKLTNLIYVIPLFLLTVYLIAEKKQDIPKRDFKKILMRVALYCFAMIGVNFFLFINIQQSGNPFFPYYNNIFQSIYYSQLNWHFNFGPVTMMQKIFYPFYAIKDPRILGEVKDMLPDVKLIVEFLFVLFFSFILFFKKQVFNKYEKSLLFIFIASFLFWQSQFGYSRYGIFLEILGGVLSIIFIVRIFSKGNKWYFLRFITIFYIIFLIFQTVKIVNFNYNYDISWRPTVSFGEWQKMFFSYSIFDKYTEINEDLKNALKDTDIVIQCANPSSAYFSTIKELSSLPMVNFDKGNNGIITTNEKYTNKRDENVFNFVSAKRKNLEYLNFAIVLNKYNGLPGKDKEICLKALEGYDRVIIENEFKINNFVGNKKEKLTLFTGKYKIK